MKIIIPWYKKPEQLAKCKKAIANQTFKDVDPIIWDNNEHNLGFTKAINNCLRMIDFKKEKYVIILNQDCYLKDNAVENMVKFMDENPRCGIGGIKQLSSKNKDLIVHGGCLQAFPSGMHLSGSVESGDCSINKQMPWVNGACMIVRTDMIKEIGYMDENYFLICSDSDWCYTARARHWEIWYIADAECIHEQGVSSKSSSEFEGIMLKDMVFFKGKWLENDLFRELALEIFD